MSSPASDIASDIVSIRAALRAALFVGECSEHPEHLMDAERKARAAIDPLERVALAIASAEHERIELRIALAEAKFRHGMDLIRSALGAR